MSDFYPHQTFFDRLRDLLGPDGERPPVRPIKLVQLLESEQYLSMFMPLLHANLKSRATADSSWPDYLGYQLQDDIELVLLPELVSLLTKLAVEGNMEDGFTAMGKLLTFLMRELLRRGELPVLFPLHTLSGLEPVPEKLL